MSEFKPCPVCQEQSDQCLSCAFYVVDGERIYYEKLKDFGATKDHEIRFINRIQKHRVTAFFHNGKLYIPSRQGRSVPLAIGLQWDAWQEQQAIIDDLKAQLNNMEACYIEKKKECELLESNINNLTKQFSDCYEVAYAEYKKNADSYYSGKCDAFDLAEQLAGLALRGVNNLLTDARQKAEDQINNGARLTKHQIDL